MVNVGLDVLVIDSAHGHSEKVLETIREIKKSFPDLDVIGGNVATAEGAEALIKAGADGVKVGIGPGSICTTRVIAGVGVPQVSAVAEVAEALQKKGIPLIADGGIRYSGDIAKAIVAGAHSVMIGGRMVLSGRRFTSFDYAALQAEAQTANTRLRQLNRDSRLRSDAAAEFVSR